MTTRPPAQPAYILRGHTAQIHALHFLRANTRLLSGDADGFVVLWDMVSRRPAGVWRPHEKSILGMDSWGSDKILTHGRDDWLRVWQVPSTAEAEMSRALPAEGAEVERRSPWLLHSLRVNSLSFCKFAMCPVAKDQDGVLVGVPGIKDGVVDIWELPSEKRLHSVPPSTAVQATMSMAIKLLRLQDDTLCLVLGNEAGATTVQVFDAENKVWMTMYSAKPHSQPILSLDLSWSAGRYFTSSADAVVASHPLPNSFKDKLRSEEVVSIKTGHSGQQGLAVRGDGRVFATAGWDTKIRVYGLKSLNEIAVLKWHKEGCYSIAFADIGPARTKTNEREAEDKVSSLEVVFTQAPSSLTVKQRRELRTKETHWLAAGSKDGKVSLWDIF
ncbi:WD repeat-containing protein [Microthyrium microscopicum]|uniref:ASTRA-associated protein 1 n=1 Tax=Microthyrium microscopicum TaxID=703497 RepID=A0A6A6UMZ5_9PEZI|nr:WD repeat-containing protein [Microthyrium microscopicum]